MPEQEYTWLPREDLLSFEEIRRLVSVFASLGVHRLRLTGGEPLLRRGLPELVARLVRVRGIDEVALTTNGLLLADQAEELRRAGLSRVTVSLDTLRPERFRQIARRDGLGRVLAGLEAVRAAGFRNTKIDTVVLRGTNDDELEALLEKGREIGAEVRFIEYMDVGGATAWSPAHVVSRQEILLRLAAHYGPIEPIEERSSAPADRFRLPDGLVFGIIASTTAPFCASCDRSRLLADGNWLLCLYARIGVDLRAPLRDGASDAELAERIAGAWRAREDRGAQERLAAHERGALADLDELRANPHLEMHKRGG